MSEPDSYRTQADVSASAPCRVLIAEDHTIVREGIVALLSEEPDLQIVGEAADGQQAVELAERLRPDVVVMDIGLPGLNGIEATRRIRQRLPHTKVLALTVYETDEYLEEMLRAGVSGYVLKRAAAHELIAALHRILQGEVALDPAVATNYVLRRSLTPVSTTAATPSAQPAKPAAGAEGPALSQREEEVLRLIVAGHTNRETAQILGISEKTVQTHRANIMNKLGVHHTAELVREALRRGVQP
ncbi:MAG: response regulator transcription factor [Limnochordaceae bacterium]|nr:response regulator transcription factor [Limnochordaceae bacterium]